MNTASEIHHGFIAGRLAGRSAAWLEWLTVHFCREHESLMERPEWLRDFRVTAVDATKVMEKELYALHMMIKLFSLSVAEQILTGVQRRTHDELSKRPKE